MNPQSTILQMWHAHTKHFIEYFLPVAFSLRVCVSVFYGAKIIDVNKRITFVSEPIPSSSCHITKFLMHIKMHLQHVAAKTNNLQSIYMLQKK